MGECAGLLGGRSGCLEEIKGGTDDDATKLKNVKTLRADVGAKLSTGTLPVVADLDAFLKAAAPPAK